MKILSKENDNSDTNMNKDDNHLNCNDFNCSLYQQVKENSYFSQY